jgi:hypothetical protein
MDAFLYVCPTTSGLNSLVLYLKVLLGGLKVIHIEKYYKTI